MQFKPGLMPVARDQLIRAEDQKLCTKCNHVGIMRAPPAFH